MILKANRQYRYEVPTLDRREYVKCKAVNRENTLLAKIVNDIKSVGAFFNDLSQRARK